MTTRFDDSGAQFADGSVQTTAVGASVSASLGADVLLNNTANYFDGPSLTLGPGKWLVTGKVTVNDANANAGILAKLWDGTTVYDSGANTHPGATNYIPIPLTAVITNPAGPVKISARGITSTSAKILFNASGNSKDSSLTAVRIG